MASPPPRKLRLRFSKTGKIRFTSHRDVARIWERALRRAGLPVAYTEGYSPRPKLSFGLALPTGAESVGEYLDISLREGARRADVGIEQLPALLDPALPAGVAVQAVEPLEPGTTSLQQAVVSCTWHIDLSASSSGAAVAAAVDEAWAAQEIIHTRERKGQPVTEDIRPAILRLDGVGTTVEAELATQPRSLRPAELMDALGLASPASRFVRINQWTQSGGARREVIPLRPVATPDPHAWRRAS